MAALKATKRWLRDRPGPDEKTTRQSCSPVHIRPITRIHYALPMTPSPMIPNYLPRARYCVQCLLPLLRTSADVQTIPTHK